MAHLYAVRDAPTLDAALARGRLLSQRSLQYRDHLIFLLSDAR